MTSLYFEELQIGIRSAAGPYSLTKEEIIRFAKQYDPIPRHIDEELAAQSVFGGLTASGSHTFAIYILLSGQLQPHFQVLMGLGWDELRLTNPVRPGDALDLEMTILELRPSKSKPDWGIVRNRNLLRNQKARDGAGMHFQHFRCAICSQRTSRRSENVGEPRFIKVT